jgi:hypothetical protein
MTEPTDDTRTAMAKAIHAKCLPFDAYGEVPGTAEWLLELVDAALAAYRAHPNGAAKDWCAGKNAAIRKLWQHQCSFMFEPDPDNFNPSFEDKVYRILCGVEAHIHALVPPADFS